MHYPRDFFLGMKKDVPDFLWISTPCRLWSEFFLGLREKEVNGRVVCRNCAEGSYYLIMLKTLYEHDTRIPLSRFPLPRLGALYAPAFTLRHER